jgi:hypothetical protein
MDERPGPESPPNGSDATRDGRAGSADDAPDDGEAEPSGALARVRTVGAEAVGAVVDAVLDAL